MTEVSLGSVRQRIEAFESQPDGTDKENCNDRIVPDNVSIPDSWSELEENFSRFYEPVVSTTHLKQPLRPNNQPKWRPLSRRKILEKLSSRGTCGISTVEVTAQVHRSNTELKISEDDSLSWKSVTGEDVYVSRSEILSRNDPLYLSRQQALQQLMLLQPDHRECISRAEILSRLLKGTDRPIGDICPCPPSPKSDEGVLDETMGTFLDRAATPNDINLIEDVLMQQERRLMNLVSHHSNELPNSMPLLENRVDEDDCSTKTLEKSVSLGRIYIPMDGDNKSTKEGTDYDTFGSIDSLMFEPKSISYTSDSNIAENSQSFLAPNGAEQMQDLPSRISVASKLDSLAQTDEKCDQSKAKRMKKYCKSAVEGLKEFAKDKFSSAKLAEVEGSESDESMTSVESVIVAGKQKKFSHKTYVINDPESDSGTSYATHQFFESDTSWDYVPTPNGHPATRDSDSSDMSTTSFSKTSSSDEYPSVFRSFYCEASTKECVVLLKHIPTASLPSEKLALKSSCTDASSESEPLQLYGSKHREPKLDAQDSSFIKSMNGAYVRPQLTTGTETYVVRNGAAVRLTEDLFKATNEHAPHSQHNEQVIEETRKNKLLDSTKNTKEKMEIVQKLGVPVISNNDLMIKELKERLQSKFEVTSVKLDAKNGELFSEKRPVSANAMEKSFASTNSSQEHSTETSSQVYMPTPDYTPSSTLPRPVTTEGPTPQLAELDASATWSDLESVIFAEDRSFGSEFVDWGGGLTGAETRMDSYKDGWRLWDQLAKMRTSSMPQDRSRWQTEKTKRMLLWLHVSGNTQQAALCYKSHWWKAKQKASVSWIIQKAHKNKVPGEFKEPYYKDYEGQEHLKPNIVHRLANADFYCSALANIYGDPSFHNLSHWNIIQALARKGVYVAEPTDIALTETVLIQTTPIKMSAHLAVIEAMMALYIREVVLAERVVQAIQRIAGPQVNIPTPQDQEEGLVLWIDYAAHNLQDRIQSQEQESLPVFPKVQDLSDLIDGIGLCALISYYCPMELNWEDIAVADPPSMADSLYNIGLVIRFCQDSLPYNPCLLTKEDIVYMHSSVKQNILGFVAELFFLFELEPVSAVAVTSTRRASRSQSHSQLSSPGSRWDPRNGMRRSSPSNYSIHSASSSYSAPSSSSCQRSSCSRGYGLRRQQSLNEKRRKTVTGSEEWGVPFNWRSIYPSWWWACDHKRSDNKCIYCCRQHQTQSFADQFDYYASPTHANDTMLPPIGGGLPQGISYTLPAKPSQKPPPPHPRPASLRRPTTHYHGMKAAGAPSVRRSHSMNLNDTPDHHSRSRIESRHEHQPHSDHGRESSLSDGQEEFVVQKARGYATLSDMMRHQSPTGYDSRAAAKEKYNSDTKEEEDVTDRGRLSRRGSFRGSQELQPAAGLPTKSEEKRLYGRSRSRRNSINADESQLTIENFGGSQDNLNYIGRNPDKESFVHSGRVEEDRRRSESQTREYERRDLHRPSIEEHYSSDSDTSDRATNFAEMARARDVGNYNDDQPQMRQADKKTTFAALPNQTTWKQQSQAVPQSLPDDDLEPQVMSSELHNVRMKLEEKRRRIEAEKKKVELMMNKQRQKLGKEAFMQAVLKGAKSSSTGSPNTPSDTGSPKSPGLPDLPVETPSRPSSISLKDVGNEVSNVSKKWLDNKAPQELRTPDLDAMDYDQYQNSISQKVPRPAEYHGSSRPVHEPDYRRYSLYLDSSPTNWRDHPKSYGSLPPLPPTSNYDAPSRMTDSLTDIQTDIQRLSHQQNQIQNLMHNGMQPQQNQFYLHDQQVNSPTRRMWGQGNETYSSMSPGPRRSQWGPPARPVVPQNEYMMAPQSGYYQQYQMPQRSQLPPIQMGHPQGFMLHTQHQSLPPGHQPYQPNYYNPEQYRYANQNYGDPRISNPSNNAPFRLHNDGAPNYNNIQNQPQQPPHSHQQRQKSPSPSRQSHAPVAAPPPDDMEPQKVDFIQSEDPVEVSDKIKRLSISSGSRTYRIHDQGSPTRPVLGTKTYRVPTKKGLPVHDDVDLPQPPVKERSMSPAPYNPHKDGVVTEPLQDGSDKGFYIKFDDDSAPKRPKPQLRPRKMSLKKSSTPTTPASTPSRDEPPPVPARTLKSRDSIEKTNDYPSLKLSSRPYDSQFSAITPSSSASSISPSGPKEFAWNPQTPYTPMSRNNNDSKLSDYNRLYDRESDASDMTDDIPKTRTVGDGASGIALVIENEIENENCALNEMEKKKERLMMQSMRRKQQQEEAKRKKELECELKREADKQKDDEKQRKKDEEKARREMILERHKIKKAIEEAEKAGRNYNPPAWYFEDSSGTATPTGRSSSVRMRPGRPGPKPRPKTMHEATYSDQDRPSSRAQRGSNQNISEPDPSKYLRKNNRRWGSSSSLPRSSGPRGSTGSLQRDTSSRTEINHAGRRIPADRSKKPLYGSRDVGIDRFEVHEVRRPSLFADPKSAPRRSRTRYDNPSRKYRSTGNLYGTDHDSLLYHMSEDSGLGRATPPRRAPSPGMSSRHYPSPAGPGSLPPGLFARRRPGAFDDNASDISVNSSNIDYCGPRLFKQPASKSNRPIVLNAVEHCVFPGVVNQTAKQRVMEEIARSEAKYFLFLFRDSGCQFRAIYSYNPDAFEVDKIYGTGPKQVTEKMFEKFFKYNSGGKCFSQVHTKHLSVTIDAFTIYNFLWQGKRVSLPAKRDMKLVI